MSLRGFHSEVRTASNRSRSGVYVSDVNVRPIVKPAARIGSRVGVPDRPCASGEQHRQTNNGQSTFEVVHWSLSVTLMVSDGASRSAKFGRGRGQSTAHCDTS